MLYITAECPVCLEVMPADDRTLLLGCYHVFCGSCAAKSVNQQRMCPLCRAPASIPQLLRLLPPQEEGWGRFGSKVRAVVERLQRIRDEDPTQRAIVFVQWHALRTKIEAALAHFGFGFVALAGSVWTRGDILQDFQAAPKVRPVCSRILPKS